MRRLQLTLSKFFPEGERATAACSSSRTAVAEEVVPRSPGHLILAVSFLLLITVPLHPATSSVLDVAIDFDGKSFIETGVNAADLGIEGNAAKTIEAWVYTRAFNLHGGVFSLGNRGGGQDFSLITRESEDQWRVVFWGGDMDFTHASKNRWMHVALVYTGREAIIYADGAERNRITRDLDTSAAEPFRIGRWWDRADGLFDGLITEVRIWNRALERDEVQARMDSALDGDEPGLVGYWPLREGTGRTAQETTAGNDGRFTGNPQWVLARPFTVDLPEQKDADPGDSITLGPVELRMPQGEVTYQWFFNGDPIDGATSSTLDIKGMAADNVGVYHVLVNDDHHLTPVASTHLRISDWPVWRQDLKGAAVNPGETVTLGPVELYDPHGVVSYQWYRDDQPIEGATASTLTIDDVSKEHFGIYHVVVNDDLDLTPVASARERLVEPDWPMWRFDPQRSANSPHVLADELYLHWVRELPEPKRAWPFQMDDRGKLDFDISYAPVVLGRRIFVPSNVTDSVTAYDIENGAELWRFYTDGPVRLAPAAYEDSVYFVSDDGHLYCVDAANGDLRWKFRGGPSDQRLLGNERIINFWAARGGPVIYDRTVYFAAGIWPLHGVFIYALDAVTGDIKWINDTTSSDYVALPHGGAYGYGGLAPQGYIAVAGEELIVAGGRTPPAYFDRGTGEFLRAQFRPPARPFWDGDYAVHAGGMGMKRNAMLEKLTDNLAGEIEGELFYKLAARDRLFVTTIDGRLYCFGPEHRGPLHHAFNPEPVSPHSDRFAATAEILLREVGETEGYALMLGSGSGDLLRELIKRSDFHVVVVENDPDKARQLRDEFVDTGVSGRRAAVIETDPADFSVQPYLFTLIISEDAGDAGISADARSLGHYLELLRPYGGIAWLGLSADNAAEFAAAARETRVDQVSVAAGAVQLLARRGGPLSGAGDWTHQYQGPGNTLFSSEDRVRLPLGLLWFGGPSNHDILPRHAGGPRPQVVGGRQVYLGVETIGARCVYTGRRLWSREFPGVGHPFTILGNERVWSDGIKVYMAGPHGATYIGSPFVTLPDSVYLRYEGKIHRLDPATGETMAVFAPPGRSAAEIYGDENAPEWGHISVQGDMLIATSEPHVFENQRLGWVESYSGSSSRRIAVMNRFSGDLIWEREAGNGFRHNAIAGGRDTIFLVDGLSSNALDHLARRGEAPRKPLVLLALDLHTGEERWRSDEDVFGTFLVYSETHDILYEGGNNDYRTPPPEDEPIDMMLARQGSDGQVLWQRRGRFTLPGAIGDELLISGRPGPPAILPLTGDDFGRDQRREDGNSAWRYARAYGCGTLNASNHMLLFRTGYGGFFDLEHESGTGTFGGFRSGCTSNLIAADGILNALEYTRTCTCSYAHQTSLALIHMPGDNNIEAWTQYEGAPPDPKGYGLNFGAPGGRVDVTGSGRVWHSRDGTHRRHASAIKSQGNSISWILASALEIERQEPISIDNIDEGTYEVRLHFAELEADINPGERLFHVSINGEKILQNYDISVQTGGTLRGVVESISVDGGGNLDIEFHKVEGSRFAPLINGIEIIYGE